MLHEMASQPVRAGHALPFIRGQELLQFDIAEAFYLEAGFIQT
ncbi:MAG: hypothetical protein JWM96_879, partial [Alphaproteobacteria bacterium]|nr:hypothetical protein [Alphaproteobacteria bacterium]